MMEYEIDEYLYHADHGVGIIREISEGNNPNVRIKFEKNPNFVLTTFHVSHSCKRLSPDGFRVFAYNFPDDISGIILDYPEMVIEMTLQDFPNQRAKTDELKNYLQPYIPEWTKWWKDALQKLKTSNRIDTSRSRYREYGLHQEDVIPVEEKYQYYQSLKLTLKTPQDVLYKQAKSVVESSQGGTLLIPFQVNELKSFFNKLISNDQVPDGLRFDALFYLREVKWLSEKEFDCHLNGILSDDIKIYELSEHGERLLLDQLIKNHDGTQKSHLLMTGICASHRSMQLVHDLALEKADPDWNAELIIVGLGENIPPENNETDFKILSKRIYFITELIKTLPDTNDDWEKIIGKLNKLVISFGQIKNPSQIEKIPFISLSKFGGELFSRVQNINFDLSSSLIDNLADPNLPSDFILGLLDGTKKGNVSKDFVKSYEDSLYERIEKKHKELFIKLFAQDGDITKDEYAAHLAEIVNRYPGNLYVVDKAGSNLLDLCQRSEPEEWIGFLPALEYFSKLDVVWNWQIKLDEFRRKAYLAALNESRLEPKTDYRGELIIQDPVLLMAIKDYVYQENANLKERLDDLQRELELENQHMQELRKHISDQESIMRELRSGIGGDTQEARFEERQKVLRHLASTVAEFERYFNSKESLSPDLSALMRRLNSLLISNGVISMNSIGDVIKFDPTYARTSEGEECLPGDEVMVIERGFKIQDSRGETVVLKPAICKVLAR